MHGRTLTPNLDTHRNNRISMNNADTVQLSLDP
jgi:hypothetical protein